MKVQKLVCLSLISMLILQGCGAKEVTTDQVTLTPNKVEELSQNTEQEESETKVDFVTLFNNAEDDEAKKEVLKNTFSKNYQIVLEDRIKDIPVAKFLYRVWGDDILYEGMVII